MNAGQSTTQKTIMIQ